jgi:hypothetical protein
MQRVVHLGTASSTVVGEHRVAQWLVAEAVQGFRHGVAQRLLDEAVQAHHMVREHRAHPYTGVIVSWTQSARMPDTTAATASCWRTQQVPPGSSTVFPTSTRIQCTPYFLREI